MAAIVTSIHGPGNLFNHLQSLTNDPCQDVAAPAGYRPTGPSRLPGTFHVLPLVDVIVPRDPVHIVLAANSLRTFVPVLGTIVVKTLVNVYIFMQLHPLRKPLQHTPIHLQNVQPSPNPIITPNLSVQIKNNRTGHLIERPRNRRGMKSWLTNHPTPVRMVLKRSSSHFTIQTGLRPQVIRMVNSKLRERIEGGLKDIAADIPSASCCDMFRILAGAGLLDKVDLTMARRLYNPSTN